jgi:hypothetical protein
VTSRNPDEAEGKSRQHVRTAPAAGTVVAGGGAGGLFVFVFTNYARPPLQDILLYLAPTLAILTSACYEMLGRWIGRKVADRELRQELVKAERYLAEIENDAKSSAAHKAEARQRVEALRLLVMGVHTKRVQAIADDQS